MKILDCSLELAPPWLSSVIFLYLELCAPLESAGELLKELLLPIRVKGPAASCLAGKVSNQWFPAQKTALPEQVWMPLTAAVHRLGS